MDRICFFVDSDLSVILGDQLPSTKNFYKTDEYSIENSICNHQCFERVLSEIFNVTGLDEAERSQMHFIFQGNLQTFNYAMLDVMAQICLWMRHGAKTMLNNFDPCSLFVAVDGIVRLRTGLDSGHARVQKLSTDLALPPSTDLEVQQAMAEIQQRYVDSNRCIRGKYILSFFVFCAKEMHASLRSWCPRLTAVPNPKMTLGPKSAMSAVAPRARCPDSLRSFLQANYGAYITATGLQTPE